MKLLQKENAQYFVKDFNENRHSIKEAALDLTLYFLREMKQDEAADTLEDKLVFIHQLKCGLKEKYQCVFEGIAKQGDSILLNNIYTDLYITQGCSEQVNTEHEVRQIEVASRCHDFQEIPIECKNLFDASAQDKEIRTVLTKGVAGIGKSVSVQKFVLDWAEGKENQDISFIFPLPFREINLKEKQKQSLMDIIAQFLPEAKGLNLKRRNHFKVLFILDGLDECRLPLNFEFNETWHDVSSPASLDVLLTNLIKGNLFPSAHIWITTRPAATSKIPPDCIDRVTEIRGFNDAQKEEYFRKRFIDDNLTKEIIDHVKQSKSLFIMCHIPVFCWISATVLQNILEEKRSVKNNQADDASKTLQESNTEDTPKTLTQMYTHFLRFQILQSRRKYDGEYTPDVSWDKDAILSLGKLAFHQLERNNLIFYESDLEACGIDVYKASVYSGMCTQIFKEETGIILGTMYCFVHLSIQEFIAALYAHLFLDINKKNVFVQDSMEPKKNESMIDLLKTAVDKALECDNGHLDLFLRFLLGLSLQSNRLLLRGLLPQEDCKDQSKKEIVQYIKQKFEANLSPERSINLFYCLNELNDQSLVKEIQTHLRKGSLSSTDLSPAQWSALAFVLLTSEKELEEFELQKFRKSDECLIRLSTVIKTHNRALLNDCNLTDRSCSALVTVLESDNSLKELNMNNNNLQDSGVKLLCIGLKNMTCKLEILRLSMCELTEESCSALASILSSDSSSLKDLDLSNNNIRDSGVTLLSDGLKEKCKLEKLRLSNCSITEEGYKALASALRSNTSHLIELDLMENDPGQSGVKELNDLLQDPNCKLKTLRFLGPAADEAFQYVTGVVGKNPLLLTELNLSERELGDTRVNQIAALLQDKHCQLNTLILNNDSITEEGCAALTSAFNSNPSNLIELDLSGNKLGNSGMMKICCLLKNTKSRLMKLKLSDCGITEEGYKALASALRSNPSHLIELDLKGNDPGQSGVKELNDLLQDPNCQLKTLRFLFPAADEACQFVTGIVGKNLLLLSELNLSGRYLVDTRVNQIAALLQDKHCQLSTLILCGCKITEKQCLILSSALKSNPSHLRELNLSGNKLKDSGVKNLSDLLMNPQCKLEKLELCGCRITEKQCLILTSALKSNQTHLRELDLSENKIKNTGVKHLCDILNDSDCKLERLSLHDCGITDVSFLTHSLTNTKALQFLKELDLSYSVIGQSKQELIYVLRHSNCKLLEKEHWLTTSLGDINLS
ncbi:NACHT, LRR and PYD domains-containing protein 3-like isoform X2 [Labeo rohita]|nr:NACHT, LRR and PYD domains-containing protein 3-like isoform X2 [Labeo rohita]